MAKNHVPSRVLIGRLTVDGPGRPARVTVLGAGIAVDPSVVMAPLSLSAALRPRSGVVVLPEPDTPAFDAVPVASILRSEPGTGDVLGLVLRRPLARFEEPPTTDAHGWLEERLQAEATDLEQRGGLDTSSGGASPDSLPRGRRSPVCIIWPPACK